MEMKYVFKRMIYVKRKSIDNHQKNERHEYTRKLYSKTCYAKRVQDFRLDKWKI